MDPTKLTEKAQEAITAAQRLAEERHHPILLGYQSVEEMLWL